MIILLKLLLAHLIGDFVLQPSSWVQEKEQLKVRSWKLYLHFLIHGLLTAILLFDKALWYIPILVVVLHGAIDLLKIYFQTGKNRVFWFILDQFFHVLSLIGIWLVITQKTPDILPLFSSVYFLAIVTGLLFVTQVSALLLQVLLKNWSKELDLPKKYSLQQAGKYIGILERLFVFTFVLLGKWEAVGFLLTAKSVFRFSDLSRSKDRKLTEYILVGTLLSFALAISAGLFVNWVSKI